MVLESIINPFKAETNPARMFFIGALYASLGLWLSLWIFEKHASLVMVFLTVLFCVPLVFSAFKLEEKKDLEIEEEKKLLKEHWKAISFLVFLFMGITVAYSLWYSFLPSEKVQSLFYIQQQTITEINNQVVGRVSLDLGIISKIFFNNIRVLAFCILFSFIYGMGAIFILTWNASVIGVAIGNFVRNNITSMASGFGFSTISNYFQIISLGLLKYSVHGIPEIAAYFVGGLAGGIISMAIIKHDIRTAKFGHVLMDSADLIILAIVMLFVAALLEVFVTPLLF